MAETPPPPDDAAAREALRRIVGSTAPSKPARRRRPRATTGRDPMTLGEGIDQLVTDQGWQERADVARLVSGWSGIVGDDVASHVTPAAFDNGELVLQADSTSWATQVRMLLPTLRTAIDEAVGTGVVERSTVRGPQGPSWVAGPLRVKGRGPRDTYG